MMSALPSVATGLSRWRMDRFRRIRRARFRCKPDRWGALHRERQELDLVPWKGVETDLMDLA